MNTQVTLYVDNYLDIFAILVTADCTLLFLKKNDEAARLVATVVNGWMHIDRDPDCDDTWAVKHFLEKIFNRKVHYSARWLYENNFELHINTSIVKKKDEPLEYTMIHCPEVE